MSKLKMCIKNRWLETYLPTQLVYTQSKWPWVNVNRQNLVGTLKCTLPFFCFLNPISKTQILYSQLWMVILAINNSLFYKTEKFGHIF